MVEISPFKQNLCTEAYPAATIIGERECIETQT